MKKKLFALLTAVCMIISLLPMIAMAETNDLPGVNFYYVDANGAYANNVLVQGEGVKYYKENAIGGLEETTEDDYTVKLEYLQDEIPTLYLKGANITNGPLILESADTTNTDLPVNIVVEEDTVINSQGRTLLPRLTMVLPSFLTFLCLTSFSSKSG